MYVVTLLEQNICLSCFLAVDPIDEESSKMDMDLSRAGFEGLPIKRTHMECKCGVKNCRKYLF